ncbi:Mitochondrial ATP synthase epsilon chain [Seminavis robusta]|uniref:Mitochondrial ATP synthase epsilon chain n=1 Tax=Seminavis robusta TaxID=568900 RepID=A0A9N8EUH8_9STRA|nr:Mitochondrial ATP synthase epsilon chain [Seminavis robusta]|eukprot:Sro1798_g298300.1 Mitochondrial ATP synthase epsilon chain (72) ;mRNA; f:20932-21307
MSPPVTTYWRLAGMSYLQYVNKAASTMRGALKEPAKTKAMAQEAFQYNTSVWSGGVQGAKTPVTSMGAAGK